MAPAIVLMRHAEKPEDREDMHLSPAGRRRAELLARFIPATFGRPDVLVAAAQKANSRRPVETLLPLARATGLPIDATHADGEGPALAAKLLGDDRYAGTLVVVAWRHNQLPALALALGAPPGLCPDPWPDDLYDLVLRFDRGGGVTAVTQPF